MEPSITPVAFIVNEKSAGVNCYQKNRKEMVDRF